MGTLGDRIKFLRDSNNITMKTLSEATKISKGNLSSYENNKFKPSADAIILISEYFGVTTDWLLTGKDPKQQNSSNVESNVEHILGKLSDEEIHFIELLRQVDEKERNKIEGMLDLKIVEAKDVKKDASSAYQNGDEDAATEENLA